jgi:hypothetical protein
VTNDTPARRLRRVFRGACVRTKKKRVARISGHEDGILCAPTAFGKTAVAAWLIANRQVNTLVQVHRQQLLDQYRDHGQSLRGKNLLAKLIAWRACQANQRGLFTTSMDMLNHLLASQVDHSLVRKLKSYTEPSVLV